MKVNAFFLFPESDDDFFALGDDPEVYITLIKEVADIKIQLKKNNGFQLYYDSDNLTAFLNKAGNLITARYLGTCKTQLQTIFGNFSTNIHANKPRMTDCIYAHWNIECNIQLANDLVSETAELTLTNVDEKIIIVNVADAYKTNREYIYIIKDAIKDDSLPKLISIPLVSNQIGFAEWILSFNNAHFSLKDKSKFVATSFRWKKQTIYREINTGDLWYIDYFHKDNNRHYEVFNSTGIHRGEADTNGNLATNKADSNKRIDNVIHGD